MPLNRLLLACLTVAFASAPLDAQDSTAAVAVTVAVFSDTTPLTGALVSSGDVVRVTDERGTAVLRLLPGVRTIVAARIGFERQRVTVTLAPASDTTIRIVLVPQAVEVAGVTVSATRTGRRIEDEPMRVEALGAEEIEEKVMMTPGDITMMLNESSGLRVQVTSPALGGAAVRVQGLRGRYTQVLADGLPSYGAQTGSLGLLQIPPLDLGRVEIIKGVASALYGGSALGGVINLISRRPGEEHEQELLLNQTTLNGTDAVGFLSGPVNPRWGYTTLVGVHRQSQVDKDGDAWADVAGYERLVVRPRVFWSSPTGHSLIMTLGTTIEDRNGGQMEGESGGTGVAPEGLRTNRYDAGLVGGLLLGRSVVLSARVATVVQRHRHLFFSNQLENDEHLTWLGETSLAFPYGSSTTVIGAALQGERYRGEEIDRFDFSHRTPGVFAQTTVTVVPAISLTASVRADEHSEYGTQISPRFSTLLRLGPTWTLRGSAGGGYFAPTPFTEETEVIGLRWLEPLRDFRAERARSASVDLGGGFGDLELNATLFGSRIDHPIGMRESPARDGYAELFSRAGPVRTAGGELLLRWNPEPIHVTTSYTFVRSSEDDPETGARREVPLTPRHQAGIVTMWEREEEARVGVEVYYTGVQQLEDATYRSESKPYVHVGVLVERRFGSARLFLNAENLLNVRQTHYDRLLRTSPAAGSRWTTDVWAPLDGRVANIGVRWER